MGTEHFKFFRRGLIALAFSFCISMFLPAQANAGFSLGDASHYAVLYEGSGTHNLQINSSPVNGSTILGDIGLGNLSNGFPTAQFNNPAVINGNINFSSNISISANAVINGTTNGQVSQVKTDLLNLNALSSTLGGEAGSNVAINISNGNTLTLNASNGILDGSGNNVFTATALSFVNGATLVINGSASQFVVINFNFNTHFSGVITLTGGITPDQVLFNMIGGANLTGGDTLQFAANNVSQAGTFLDPNGVITMNSVNLRGHIFGGDASDMQIVSGGTIVVPEPSSYALVLSALGMLGMAARSRAAKK